MLHRTNHRILVPLEELSLEDRSKLLHYEFDSLEFLTKGGYVASYVDDNFFLLYQDLLFPMCPVTGIIGTWDEDWKGEGEE